MRQERDGESSGDDGEVISAEIGVIFSNTDGGFGEGFGFGEAGAVDELRPRAAVGEAGANGL